MLAAALQHHTTHTANLVAGVPPQTRQPGSRRFSSPCCPQTQALSSTTKKQKNSSKGSTSAADAAHAGGDKGDENGRSTNTTAAPPNANIFLAWALRQSKQRKQPLREFILQSAQEAVVLGGGACKLNSNNAATATATTATTSNSNSATSAQNSAVGGDADDTIGLQDVLSVLTSSSSASASPTAASPASQQQQVPEQQQQQPNKAQPFQPHNGYVSGPPKPHCHEARVAAADGIQALRRTRDGELGELLFVVCGLYCVLVVG